MNPFQDDFPKGVFLELKYERMRATSGITNESQGKPMKSWVRVGAPSLPHETLPFTRAYISVTVIQETDHARLQWQKDKCSRMHHAQQ